MIDARYRGRMEAEPELSISESGPGRWQAVGLAIACVAVDFFIVLEADHVRDWLSLLHTQWNWFGKCLSILFVCLVLTCSPWLRNNVGLRWRQATGSSRLSIGCLFLFLACGIAMGFLMRPKEFSIETLLFQATIPGLDEELMFRGVLLALLERAFGRSPVNCRRTFGFAGVIVSVIFGLGHAISYNDSGLQFSAVAFCITGMFAAIVALVRIRSGSLVWPIVLHNAWNSSIFAVAMLR